MKNEEKSALILILLKQLQPYLSDMNLTVTNEKKTVQKYLSKTNVQQETPTETFRSKKMNTTLNNDLLPC